MAFFNRIQGPVTKVIKDLKTDPGLSEVVTYEKYTGQVFDQTLGHNVDSYTTPMPRAVRLRHSQKSASVLGNALIEKGDLLFLFAFEDLSSPSMKDLLVDADGNKFRIKSIDPIFGLAYSITVEGS